MAAAERKPAVGNADCCFCQRRFGRERASASITDALRDLRRGALPVLDNHNRDNAGAGLSRIEVGTDGLLHRKSAALITAKPNCGRGTSLQEGDEGDLQCRPISTDDGTELYHADRTTDARGTGGQSTADKDVPATGEG
jgi:hypothetical protein